MNNPQDIINYITGGHGSFTIKSLKTGRHYTYRVRGKKGYNGKFVSLLTDGDQYVYIGMLFPKGDGWKLVRTKASKIGEDSPAFAGLAWIITRACMGLEPGPMAEFRHNGTCCRCGRELTTPESIDRGIGPVCATKAA